ncbi:MAG: hypothetical protein MJY74_04575 [Bacteroidaceae bacterium]|nr:hypothetical protein [Bacteroidaceae bacterium]
MVDYLYVLSLLRVDSSLQDSPAGSLEWRELVLNADDAGLQPEQRTALRKEKSYPLDTEIFDYAGICRFYLGLADQIKIVESPGFQQYVDIYVDGYLK